MPIFLRSLWLFALYVSDMGAAPIGLVWILGRILYFVGAVAAKQARLVQGCVIGCLDPHENAADTGALIKRQNIGVAHDF